jgi:hypothetical protein
VCVTDGLVDSSKVQVRCRGTDSQGLTPMSRCLAFMTLCSLSGSALFPAVNLPILRSLLCLCVQRMSFLAAFWLLLICLYFAGL